MFTSSNHGLFHLWRNEILVKYQKFSRCYDPDYRLVIVTLHEKKVTCHNDLEKSSTIKTDKHAACGYLQFTHCSFDGNKINFDYYRGKDCTKIFSKDLKKPCNKNN